MTYSALFSAILYDALRLGLRIEMLALKVVEDLASAVQSGCAALRESGQRQLAMLEDAQ